MNRLGVVGLGSWLLLVAAGACRAFDSGGGSPEPPEAGPEGTPADAGAEGATETDGGDAGQPGLVGCDGPCTVAFTFDSGEPHELQYFPDQRLVFAAASPAGIYQWSESAPDAAVPVSPDPAPHDLAFNSRGLFWISSGALRYQNTQCQPDTVKYLYTDRIYIDRADGLYEGPSLGINACTLAMSGPTDTRRTFAFANDTGGSFRAVDTADGGAILACATDCATGTTLVSGLGPIATLALDDNRIYWTEGVSPTQSVGVAPRVAGGSTPASHVTAPERTIQGLTASGTTAYFTDEDRGELLVSVAGAPATVVMSGLDRPWGVAASPSFVYVAEAGKGRVIRLPRP